MIRDIDFSVPTEEAIGELIMLCRAEGWTVEETDVFKYRKGVPFDFGTGIEPYIPDRDENIVYAHAPGFSYEDDSMEKIHAKADEIAEKVGGVVTGGGCSFEPADAEG